MNSLTCAGILLYSQQTNSVILVENSEGKLSVPKGKYEKKKDGPRSCKSIFNCAQREFLEETQISKPIEVRIGLEPESIFIENKSIGYFPAITDDLINLSNFKPNTEITSIDWYSKEDIEKLDFCLFKQERKEIVLDFISMISKEKIDLSTNLILGANLSLETNSMQSKRDTFVSKKLSYFLRHHLDQIPGQVSPAGFVSIDALLSMEDFKSANITHEEIIRAVEMSDKQRFGLDSTGKLIRANQGHSISSGKLIDQTQLLTKLVVPQDYCVHGTTRKAINEIKKSGLNKMSRTHIHFASKPNAISGFRSDSAVLIHVDMASAMADGIEFFMSANEVILSPGPIDPKYFKKIEYV